MKLKHFSTFLLGTYSLIRRYDNVDTLDMTQLSRQLRLLQLHAPPGDLLSFIPQNFFFPTEAIIVRCYNHSIQEGSQSDFPSSIIP